MELIQQDSDSVVIRLNSAELIAINNTLNESLESVPEWEYQTRIGISIAEAKALLATLRETLTRDKYPDGLPST